MNKAHACTKLPSGLKISSHRIENRDSVSLGIWFKVGGRYESLRISGISHFIEHLVFKGTPSRNAKRIKEEIEGRGGMLNGFTSEENTCFLIKILRKHADVAFDVLSDMVQHPLFNPSDIERERTVILEEIKMYKDMPMLYAQELINQLLWPGQPLGRLISGDFDSVKRITGADIRKFHSQYYKETNALVSVCGDIEHDNIVDMVTKRLKKNNKSASHTRCSKAQSRQSKPRFHFLEKETAQSHIVLGSHGVSRISPHRYALGLLHIIMGANMSSRLYEEVREKRGLAYEIRSNVNYFADTGLFTVSAGVENNKVEKALGLILKELEKVMRVGIRPGELRRAKEYLISQLFLALEDTLEYMLWMGEKALYFSGIPSKSDIRKKIEAVSTDDIIAIAKTVCNTKKLNLVVIGPQNEAVQKRIKSNLSC